MKEIMNTIVPDIMLGVVGICLIAFFTLLIGDVHMEKGKFKKIENPLIATVWFCIATLVLLTVLFKG